MVLPPGDWDSKNLLSMSEINELRSRKRGRKSKDMSASISENQKEQPKSESFQTNPLVRRPHIFGGLVNDIKQRSLWYWSDIKDGFSSQVFAGKLELDKFFYMNKYIPTYCLLSMYIYE